MTRAPLLVAAMTLALAVPLSAQTGGDEPPMRSSLDGVYTVEQAQEGARVYQRVCAECHAKDEYTGDMMAGWEGAPLYDLWDIITSTMPENNPGSLSRSEYVGILAYILELNNMPAGSEELSSRASALRNILFRWSDPS